MYKNKSVTLISTLVIYLAFNIFSPVSLKATPPAATPQNNNLKEVRTEEKQSRGEKLKRWLTKRNSPLVGSTSVILKTSNPALIIGISFAESSLGTNFVDSYGRKTKNKSFNCWGIKKNRRTKFKTESWNVYLAKYSSQEEAIADIDWLLEHGYKNKTPKQMARKWVGWRSPNWIYNVKKVQNEINLILK